jgi:hypothetical protein
MLLTQHFPAPGLISMLLAETRLWWCGTFGAGYLQAGHEASGHRLQLFVGQISQGLLVERELV